MFGNLLSGWWQFECTPKLEAQNENTPVRGEQVNPETVRALQTGAMLASSLDGSPAVLVNIYDYAHRYRDKVGGGR